MLERLGPPLLATAVFIGSWFALLVVGLRQTGGRFAFSLDDGYIHMAIAKNLAERGVWSPSLAGFAAASSSPLWTMILAAMHLLHLLDEYAVFLLVTLAALLVLPLADSILREHGVGPWLRGASLLLLVLLPPLATVTFTGLEHTTQILVDLAFLRLAIRSRPLLGPLDRFAYVLAPIVTSIRYEGMALVAMVSGLALVRRRFREAVMIAVLGVLPVLVMGFVSVSNGGLFAPNSVVVKTYAIHRATLIERFVTLPVAAIFDQAHLLWFLTAALCIAIVRKGFARELAAVYAGTLFLHFIYGKAGGFYRYDAYLIALGLVVLALTLHDVAPRRLPPLPAWSWPQVGAFFLAGLFIVTPLSARAERATLSTPLAMENIHDQQIQMGEFLHAYYEGRSVILNDIGAPNYLADIHCVDVWGLGTNEVAHILQDRGLRTNDVRRLVAEHNVSIAVIYVRALGRYLPPEWIPVGNWTLTQRTIAGDTTVTFFAVDPAEAGTLVQHLREFSPHVPDRVIQSGTYMGTS